MNNEWTTSQMVQSVGKFIIFIFLVVFMVGLSVIVVQQIISNNNKETTKSLVRSVVKKSSNEKPGKISFVDSWGNNLKYDCLLEENQNQITHIVVSSGPDGQFETEDDISSTKIEKNYSKLIARTIVDQAVEFGKGLKEGWNHKNKFEKKAE